MSQRASGGRILPGLRDDIPFELPLAVALLVVCGIVVLLVLVVRMVNRHDLHGPYDEDEPSWISGTPDLDDPYDERNPRYWDPTQRRWVNTSPGPDVPPPPPGSPPPPGG